MTNKENSKNSSGLSTGALSAATISLIVFSLGFLPVVIFGKIVLIFINFSELWHFLLLPFLIYIGIGATICYQLIISGSIIHIFKIRYKPGIYEYNLNNKTSFRWILICALYTPMRKMLEIFPLGKTKTMYYKMLGMKIGENTLVGGTIMDPCLTEIGDNCTMGLYAVIYGHIHDYERGTLLLDKIIIGDNCVIGAGAYIMPGAVLEDNVKLAAGAVVRKGQVLKKGKIYAGIPAKEIEKKKKKNK